MALCPNTANPAATITDGIQFKDSNGKDEDFHGDYSVAGAGTRNFGNGVIQLKDMPPGTSVLEAYLIYNTYQANNQPAPAVELNGIPAAGNLYGICGSTCWFNPPAEATTYLRNRVYIRDVGPTGLDLITGNGKYTVTKLPVDLTMPIGIDSTRLPGCKCSQGAILFVVWEYDQPDEDFVGPPTQKQTSLRALNWYLGAKLLSFNPGFWGGSTSYNLTFQPVKSTVDMNFFKGNAICTAVAGDTQNVVPGDTFAINQVRFIPPTNAFTPKVGSSLCVKKYGVAQIYDGNNSAQASTSNDCIDWFFFAISGDKTQPKAQFQIVNCAATLLQGNIDATQTEIEVFSNYVHPSQAAGTEKCRAVKFTPPDPGFVGPPAPNPPGAFPKASFYISVDKEIMKVTKKDGNTSNNRGADGALPAGVWPLDPNVWTVQRGQNGTAAVPHSNSTCVYMLAPPKFIKDMQSGLAPKGKPPQRPNPGRPVGRKRK